MTTDDLRESANYSERKGALYDARIKREAADEIDRLARRVAELELPMEKWPEVERRDGHVLGACPLCGAACLIGEYDE